MGCVARTFAYSRPRSRALAAAIGAAEAARMAPAVQVPFCGVGDYSARAAADGRSTLAVELLCEVGRIPRRTPRVETLLRQSWATPARFCDFCCNTAGLSKLVRWRLTWCFVWLVQALCSTTQRTLLGCPSSFLTCFCPPQTRMPNKCQV